MEGEVTKQYKRYQDRRKTRVLEMATDFLGELIVLLMVVALGINAL